MALEGRPLLPGRNKPRGRERPGLGQHPTEGGGEGQGGGRDHRSWEVLQRQLGGASSEVCTKGQAEGRACREGFLDCADCHRGSLFSFARRVLAAWILSSYPRGPPFPDPPKASMTP